MNHYQHLTLFEREDLHGWIEQNLSIRKIADFLDNTTFYFAHPNSSWKCGTNEKTKSLLREYLPNKQTSQHTERRTLIFLHLNVIIDSKMFKL
ncbi:helix-turn-helix domain-containing protein [Brochothrix campestris]|uniref:Integrase catalytic subunit n=1 Tax=Brochothrix campestris FSL F6-1037 TaxID=1265861 RepID=W7CT48_9LIST|nr:integrase catalytic subunit [Brochothrix campestris FSL F6-1037]